MKGPDLREEFSQAEEAIETLGGELLSLDEFELEGAGERTIAVIEKTAHTPKQYPRQSGKIKSKPL
jgi:16S rRNA (guanine527-N7)-methyltransferase